MITPCSKPVAARYIQVRALPACHVFSILHTTHGKQSVLTHANCTYGVQARLHDGHVDGPSSTEDAHEILSVEQVTIQGIARSRTMVLVQDMSASLSVKIAFMSLPGQKS